MTINIEFRFRNLFNSEILNKCYRDLFYKSNGNPEIVPEKGPVSWLIDDFIIVPAKGGSEKILREWPDVTYLTHVLNGLVLSGKLFDLRISSLYSNPRENENEIEKFVRLFFASVIMHDADKLFNEGQEGANNLHMVLEKNKQEIIKICAYYLKPLGPPIEWWNDLSFLILRTENRSMDYGNTITTKLKISELYTISQYTKIADQLGGIKYDTTEKIFEFIKKNADPKIENNGIGFHLIRFSDLPQTLLLERLNNTIMNFLQESSRGFTINFPDGIAFIGKELCEDEINEIKKEFSDSLRLNGYEDENLDKFLENFEPSGNAVRLNFSQEIKATPFVIKKYIEKFQGRLIIWSKEIWRELNPDFDIKVRRFGIPLNKKMKKEVPVFYMNLPEESPEESDEAIQRKRILGLIACAQSVLYKSREEKITDVSKEDEFSKKEFGENIYYEADALQSITIRSISHACLYSDLSMEELQNEYDRICSEISSSLVRNFDQSKLADYDDFFDRAIGNGVLIQNPPDKSSMCIQCGVFAENPLKEENSFGIKATSGSGRKITVLKYDENKFNGKICKYCMRENELRRTEIGKETEALAIQVFMGDYYIPMNLNNVIEKLRGIKSISDDLRISATENDNRKEELVLRIGNRSKKNLGTHMILFTSKPKETKKYSKTVSEFYRLSNIIDFIIKTGMKIRITPFISSRKIFKPMFEWDNSPSWIKDLHMDSVRIDQLDSVNRELKLIYQISKIDRSNNSISRVIHNLNRGKRGLFYVLWRSLAKENSGNIYLDKYKELKEGVEWYMDKFSKELNKASMDSVVDEACGIVTSGPKSNNDNTWIIREAMDLYLRYFKDDDRDLQQKIAGKIWAYANRQKYAGKETQEHSMIFAEKFVDLMRSEFGMRIPGNDYRKDMIDQFALMFNIEKWKRVKNKKEENEKDE